ncbi:MAG TPA: hypothetical protein VHM31_07110 [Polyangia bacterium]|nr:hypothetical protein [Polyangia bacterium]
MRSPILRPLFTVAAVALSTWAAACQRADSILLVEVAGDLKLMPVGFAVTVAPRAMGPRTIRVAPRAGGAISLPASFTIQLPGNATGPVTVSIDGLDANQNVMAQGTATQQNLNVGGQTIVTVTLTATGSIAVTTPPDGGSAGVDAHPGADARPAADAHPTPDGHPNDGPAPVDARDARLDTPVGDAAMDGRRAAGGTGGGGDGAAGAGGAS